jgi:hypothetical protein
MPGGIIPLQRATSSRFGGRLRQESALGRTQGAAALFTAQQSVNTDAWAGSASWIAFVDAWGLWQSIDETPTS